MKLSQPRPIIEGLKRLSELGGYNRREHTSIKRGWNDSVEAGEHRANPRAHQQNVRRRASQVRSCCETFIRPGENLRATESSLPSSFRRGLGGMAQKASCRFGSSQSQDSRPVARVSFTHHRRDQQSGRRDHEEDREELSDALTIPFDGPLQ
jgi:hypothetical protein